MTTNELRAVNKLAKRFRAVRRINTQMNILAKIEEIISEANQKIQEVEIWESEQARRLRLTNIEEAEGLLQTLSISHHSPRRRP